MKIGIRKDFWSKVKKGSSCWEWMGSRTSAGYGNGTKNKMNGDYPLETRKSQDTLKGNRNLDYARRLRYTRTRRHRHPVTVCIAAICKLNDALMVVGASDRMITAVDIEFEPPQTKIFRLSLPPYYCVALTAGDASSQATICADTLAEVRARSLTDVQAIAQTYARYFADYRRRQAEQVLLVPLGLDITSFVSHQRDLPPDVVSRLIDDLRKYELEAEAIITGVDTSGAHIYVVSDPGHALSHDSVAFAAIGIGAKHAESQFMFAGYTKDWLFPRAVLLTYIAKKRAEVAPGVGLKTDMFFIGPGSIQAELFPEDFVQDLDQIYLGVKGRAQDVTNIAYGEVEEYIKKLVSRQPQAVQQAAHPEGVSTDKEEIRGDAEKS